MKIRKALGDQQKQASSGESRRQKYALRTKSGTRNDQVNLISGKSAFILLMFGHIPALDNPVPLHFWLMIWPKSIDS
jgi:hypothetical protein